MMSLPKSWRGRVARVVLERRHQHLDVEDVDAHRGQAPGWPGGRCLRLLEEAGQPILLVDLQDAEAAGFLRRDSRCTAERRAGAALAVEAQHLRVVHLVDVVAGQHDQVPRVLAQDRVEVLVDRVGGAEVPVLADPLLRAAGSR